MANSNVVKCLCTVGGWWALAWPPTVPSSGPSFGTSSWPENPSLWMSRKVIEELLHSPPVVGVEQSYLMSTLFPCSIGTRPSSGESPTADGDSPLRIQSPSVSALAGFNNAADIDKLRFERNQ